MSACTVIGLGEAGSFYATALVEAGYTVTGYDPVAPATPAGVTRVNTAADAVRQADVVLVLTGAAAARSVATECLPAMKPGSCYADMTSSSPSDMTDIATIESPAAFADIAILGPVPLHGAKTPLMISGPGAQSATALFETLGAPAEVVGGPPGAAMAHKLLRSVLMKGLASVVVEAVEAGRAAGLEDWVRDQIAAQLAGDGHAVIDRLITGTQKHALRRSQEMLATQAYLGELGVNAEMTAASAAAMQRMATAPAHAA